MSTTASALVAACHSRACAPPPAGQGGSKGGAGSGGHGEAVALTTGYHANKINYDNFERRAGDLCHKMGFEKVPSNPREVSNWSATKGFTLRRENETYHVVSPMGTVRARSLPEARNLYMSKVIEAVGTGKIKRQE